MESFNLNPTMFNASNKQYLNQFNWLKKFLLVNLVAIAMRMKYYTGFMLG